MPRADSQLTTSDHFTNFDDEAMTASRRKNPSCFINIGGGLLVIRSTTLPCQAGCQHLVDVLILSLN